MWRRYALIRQTRHKGWVWRGGPLVCVRLRRWWGRGACGGLCGFGRGAGHPRRSAGTSDEDRGAGDEGQGAGDGNRSGRGGPGRGRWERAVGAERLRRLAWAGGGAGSALRQVEGGGRAGGVRPRNGAEPVGHGCAGHDAPTARQVEGGGRAGGVRPRNGAEPVGHGCAGHDAPTAAGDQGRWAAGSALGQVEGGGRAGGVRPRNGAEPVGHGCAGHDAPTAAGDQGRWAAGSALGQVEGGGRAGGGRPRNGAEPVGHGCTGTTRQPLRAPRPGGRRVARWGRWRAGAAPGASALGTVRNRSAMVVPARRANRCGRPGPVGGG